MLQRTEKWHEDRRGMITASMFKAVMSKGRGKTPSESRLTYMAGLIADGLGAIKREVYAASLEHGEETEPRGIGAYEWATGVAVEEVGFIVHPRYDFIGCSPDGLVEDDGGLEIKCPANVAIHIKTVMRKEMPREHVPQVQGGMWVTERSHWDFVSYSPNLPPPWDFYCQRIQRDDEYIDKLELACLLFRDEMQAIIAEVEGRQ